MRYVKPSYYCKMLGISRETLEKAIEMKQVEAVRIGHSWRILIPENQFVEVAA